MRATVPMQSSSATSLRSSRNSLQSAMPATTSDNYDNDDDDIEGTSWDAIASTSDNHHNKNTVPVRATSSSRPASTVVSGSSRSSGLNVRRASFRNRRAARAKYQNSSASTSTSTSTQPQQPQQPVQSSSTPKKETAGNSNNSASAAGGGGNNRIARLASLFSSRATITSADASSSNNNNHESSAASSSNHSSSSAGAGYAAIAWPGTQDRKGSTVVVHDSSHEESDTNPPYSMNMPTTTTGTTTSRVVTPPSSLQHKKQQQQHQNRNQYDDYPNSNPYFAEEMKQAHENFSTNDDSNRNPPNDFHSNSHHRQHHPQPIVDFSSSPMMMTMENANHHDDASFSSSSAYSDTSSAYFTPNQFQTIRAGGKINHVHGLSSAAPASVMRRKQQQQQKVTAAPSSVKPKPTSSTAVKVQPLSESALRARDAQQAPLMKAPVTARGFAGLLHKTTKDMPNLMDDEVSEYSTNTYSQPQPQPQQPQQPQHRTMNLQSTTPRRLATNPEHEVLQQPQEEEEDIFKKLDARPYQEAAAADSVVVSDEEKSDVFEDVSSSSHHDVGNDDGLPYMLRGAAPREDTAIPSTRATTMSGTNNGDDELGVVMLGGGLTTIQTTMEHFSNRLTATEYDDNLSTSDVDQYGYAKIPRFHQMISAGRRHRGDGSLAGIQGSVAPYNNNNHHRHHNNKSEQQTHDIIYRTHRDPHQSQIRAPAAKSSPSSSPQQQQHHNGSDSGGSSLFPDPYRQDSWGHNVRYSLSQYYVHPDEMKRIVRKFRKLSQLCSTDLSYDDLQRQEDATRAFALSEMRSRIMEKDIERGLERRGGTKVVDDMVLTPYNREAMRIRDAVIVSKAWRDGSTPRDVINTALLTQQPEKTYSIKRPHWFFGEEQQSNRQRRHKKPYRWQKVTWIDDMEFSRYRCLSLGSRAMRGYEMFTIGDCQSILLKLTNERCVELRAALNVATANQIEAEDFMRAESQYSDGMMSEAEMLYLTAVEGVKKISHELVVAEKSFTLVRDRIEKLVAKYEALLVKFENEASSNVGSSVITYESSSYYSDAYSSTDEEERERKTLERRAQRAELRAELAAREALLAKEEARLAREEKENELNELKMKLLELQSEASNAITEREHSVVLARAISANKQHGSPPLPPSKGGSNNRISKSKIDDVKRRFRDRTAAKKLNNSTETASTYASTNQSYRSNTSPEKDQASRERSNLFRTLGEEMFQNLDFYERSLKAVEGTTTA